MRFGLDIAQHQLTFDELIERARLAEDAGFDGVWVFDHFKALYADPKGPSLEAWTLLAGLARETTRVRLGPLVTGMTHRHPSVLAAEVVTVDHLSGGRVECAVGAAWNEAEHRELGIEFPSARDRVDRLEESIQVLRKLFTEDDVTFEGRHFKLRSATYRPRPVQQPHPPIWVGGSGRKRLLPIAGRHADVWHGWADNAAELALQNAIIDRAAQEAGRDPRQVLRASSLSISEPWDEVKRSYEWMREGGIAYLVVEWPTEGRARLEEFIADVMPTLV
ncbi:MAG TPA: TIGR03560 family F420-dependent LLM class oxidoreductase [Actinomycetota bacterium]|jgi:F420-dependent oxidoreductase-like protein|nr:TIGR03560 family F420-dependent LLM class oxidoreductase [Actinomycetota bacterium]